MRYIFVSDIHGRYDKLQAALQAVNFDEKVDTIVSVGDPFDRGLQSYEVLKFLLSCPNRILIWGNHDLDLYDLMRGREWVQGRHYQNGVLETFKSFTKMPDLSSINTGIQLLRTDAHYVCFKLINQYFRECCFAVEFADLVATHGWVPVFIDSKISYPFYQQGNRLTYYIYRHREDWRNADFADWVDATWSHSQTFFEQKVFLPDKKLLIGHWHAWRLRLAMEQSNIVYKTFDDIDFSTFEYEDKLVAIDGCSNVDRGVVNAYVYESDEEPRKFFCNRQ